MDGSVGATPYCGVAEFVMTKALEPVLLGSPIIAGPPSTNPFMAAQYSKVCPTVKQRQQTKFLPRPSFHSLPPLQTESGKLSN